MIRTRAICFGCDGAGSRFYDRAAADAGVRSICTACNGTGKTILQRFIDAVYADPRFQKARTEAEQAFIDAMIYGEGNALLAWPPS